MAAGNGRRGGERVLGSGHLVGLFLAVVVLCCVFYTLGFMMGRSQEDSVVRAASVEDTGTVTAPTRVTPANLPASAAPTDNSSAAPANGEWDFSAKNSAQPSGLTPSAGNTAAVGASANGAMPADLQPAQVAPPNSAALPAVPSAKKPAAAARASNSGLAHFQPPRIPNGAFILQMAALNSESDALAMASALQNKEFPAFVVTPTTDKFFRVQVGPYADAESTKVARAALDRAGFTSIVKH
jgi:DedD protein